MERRANESAMDLRYLAQLIEKINPKDLAESEALFAAFQGFIDRLSDVERARLLRQHAVNNNESRVQATVTPVLAISQSRPYNELLNQEHFSYQPVHQQDSIPEPLKQASPVKSPSSSKSKASRSSHVGSGVSKRRPGKRKEPNILGSLSPDHTRRQYDSLAEQLNISTKSYNVVSLLEASSMIQDNDSWTFSDVETFWSSSSSVFTSDPSGRSRTRVERLSAGLRQASKNTSQFTMASRLGRLFLLHEIDFVQHEIKSAVDNGMIELDYRETCKMRAVRCVSDSLLDSSGSKQLNIQHEAKQAKSYLYVGQNIGLGSLLMLGTLHAYRFVRLNNSELELFVAYWKTMLPRLHQRALDSNLLAADLLLRGLQEYGWTKSELQNVDTELTQMLRKAGIFAEPQCGTDTLEDSSMAETRFRLFDVTPPGHEILVDHCDLGPLFLTTEALELT